MKEKEIVLPGGIRLPETLFEIQMFEADENPQTEDKRCLGLILSGKAEVTTVSTGKEAHLRYLNPGDVFGIACLFGNAVLVTDIKTRKKTKIAFLTEERVFSLLQSNGEFLRWYLSYQSDRIRYLNRKIAYLTSGDATNRVALYLLSYQSDDFILRDSCSDLSELLGIGRASLYRVLESFETKNLLKKEGNQIHILQRNALQSICGKEEK